MQTSARQWQEKAKPMHHSYSYNHGLAQSR